MLVRTRTGFPKSCVFYGHLKAREVNAFPEETGRRGKTGALLNVLKFSGGDVAKEGYKILRSCVRQVFYFAHGLSPKERIPIGKISGLQAWLHRRYVGLGTWHAWLQSQAWFGWGP